MNAFYLLKEVQNMMVIKNSAKHITQQVMVQKYKIVGYIVKQVQIHQYNPFVITILQVMEDKKITLIHVCHYLITFMVSLHVKQQMLED